MGFHFHVDFLQFLSPEGELSGATPEYAREPALLLKLYRAMTRARAFDGKAIALQRTGQLGTFASALGQEAIGVGVASAMSPEDVLVPSYRDHAGQFVRGMSMTDCLLYWGGDERGNDYALARHDFPCCVPVATQVPHAVGVAYAFMLRKEPRVAVCFIGDGGTSNGAFYEALNMAGVWKTPVVIVINNNRWAISTPRERESAAETLAQKGIAAGVESRQIDGNDVIAVHHAARLAIEKARNGGGASLIEAVTYRLGDHTTADDATRYRDQEIVRQHWTREPIARLRAFLTQRGLWSKDEEARLLGECGADVDQAVSEYLSAPKPRAEAMFEHLYGTLPPSMAAQLDEARRFAPAEKNGHG